MKDMTHFSVGVALASCFPFAVQGGRDGNPLYVLLGGGCALLPTLLDGWFPRVPRREDIEVIPDPLRSDPQLIADALADAVARASATQRPVTLRLHPIRLDADLWQRYDVRFDAQAQCVHATYGPRVTGAGEPVAEGGVPARASSPLCGPIQIADQALTRIAVREGAPFQLVPSGNERLRILSLARHRAWSHSGCVALVAGGLAAFVWGVPAGGVALSGALSHLALDVFGYNNAAWLFPLAAQTTPGMRRWRSRQAFPNLLVIWAACLLTFWNLARFAPAGLPLDPFRLVFYAFCVPFGGYQALQRLVGRPPRV